MQSSGQSAKDPWVRKQQKCRFPTPPHYPPTILALPPHYLEPVVGFEPTTDGLQNRCSTTELNWLKHCQSIHCVHISAESACSHPQSVWGSHFCHEKGRIVTDRACPSRILVGSRHPASIRSATNLAKHILEGCESMAS